MTLPVKLRLECFLTLDPKPVTVHVVTDGDLERTLAEIDVDDYMVMARQIQGMFLKRDGTTHQIEDLLTQANIQRLSSDLPKDEYQDADFVGAYDSLLTEIIHPMARILKGLTA